MSLNLALSDDTDAAQNDYLPLNQENNERCEKLLYY
jgi:hypothetical protein